MNDQKQIELTEVLASLTANNDTIGFTVHGGGFPDNESSYNRMAIFDDVTHRPSWVSVVAEYDRLVSINEAEKYAYQRASEYPSMQEQLDTIFHGGLEAWKEQIQAIKDKYPKPE
jgi:hypothetical protein